MIDDAHPVEPALPPAITLLAPDDVALGPVARPARSGRPGYLPDRSGMSPPRRRPPRPRVTGPGRCRIGGGFGASPRAAGGLSFLTRSGPIPAPGPAPPGSPTIGRRAGSCSRPG